MLHLYRMVVVEKKADEEGGESKMELTLLETDKKSGRIKVHMKGTNPSLANALRRAIMERVPTMAIESVEYFKYRCFKGLKQKGFNENQKYIERLNYEISTIEKMGFSGYFLIVSDFINWAKQSGIPMGPGRGSGAGG